MGFGKSDVNTIVGKFQSIATLKNKVYRGRLHLMTKNRKTEKCSTHCQVKWVTWKESRWVTNVGHTRSLVSLLLVRWVRRPTFWLILTNLLFWVLIKLCKISIYEPMEKCSTHCQVMCVMCVMCVTRKQTLRSLSLPYQKKNGRAWPCPSFFWYDTDFSEFDSADIIDYILEESVSCQKRDDNNKDLKACFLVMRIK